MVSVLLPSQVAVPVSPQLPDAVSSRVIEFPDCDHVPAHGIVTFVTVPPSFSRKLYESVNVPLALRVMVPSVTSQRVSRRLENHPFARGSIRWCPSSPDRQVVRRGGPFAMMP